DRVRALQDLERVRHVGRARHSWHVALDLGIALQPMLAVLLLLRGCPRLGRDVVAFDDALAGRHAADGPKRSYQWVWKFYVCGSTESCPSAAPGRRAQRLRPPGGVGP